MIVNIRGMSGSGKSTAVKNIMTQYSNCSVLIKQDSQPLLYHLTDPKYNDLIVIGSYENKEGIKGADRIPYFSQIKYLVKYFADHNYDVVFEHMMISLGPRFVLDLVDEHYDVTAMLLEVPLAQVQQQRRQRSIATGRTGEFNNSDMKGSPKPVVKAFEKLEASNSLCCKRTTQQTVVQDYLDAVGLRSKTVLPLTDSLWDIKCKFQILGAKNPNKNKTKTTFQDLFTE